MKYQIIGKNIEVTEGIKDAVIKSLDKLNKYFKSPEDLECRVVVRSYKMGAKIKVMIVGDNVMLRAEDYHDDLYAAIDLVVDKLEGQIRKTKTRMDRSNDKLSLGKVFMQLNDEADEEETEEIKVKEIPATRLNVDEAITKMEALGYTFFLYLDSEDNRPSVVYKKLDGGYGLLELEKEN